MCQAKMLLSHDPQVARNNCRLPCWKVYWDSLKSHSTMNSKLLPNL